MTPRPPPLRTDGSNEFAHYSMKVRVPKILADTALENPDYPDSVRGSILALADGIRDGAPLPELAPPALDEGEWGSFLASRRWLATDWFFAECYVYRCLMAAARYWETGRDPFAPAKRNELASDNLWSGLESSLAPRRRAEGRAGKSPARPDERVASLLARALWGNRVDLSYAVGSAFGREGETDDLLVDDRAWATEQLLRPGGDVHIVADNTGSELSMDLVLADALMDAAGARVTLHVKMHPMFVSDATVADVWNLASAMRERGGAPADLASRLERRFEQGALRVLPDFYWNGPRFLWDRPSRISRELDVATMVVLKGDANYRRAIGDAAWPAGATFADATSYLPAPLVAVRTMKSDASVGLSSTLVSELDATDPKWRINGRRGLIQGRERPASKN